MSWNSDRNRVNTYWDAMQAYLPEGMWDVEIPYHDPRFGNLATNRTDHIVAVMNRGEAMTVEEVLATEGEMVDPAQSVARGRTPQGQFASVKYQPKSLPVAGRVALLKAAGETVWPGEKVAEVDISLIPDFPQEIKTKHGMRPDWAKAKLACHGCGAWKPDFALVDVRDLPDELTGGVPFACDGCWTDWVRRGTPPRDDNGGWMHTDAQGNPLIRVNGELVPPLTVNGKHLTKAEWVRLHGGFGLD